MIRKSSVRILATTNDEAQAAAMVDSFLPSKKYGKERVFVWNLIRPDMRVDTKEEWVVFEVMV